jgi:hypothetical protein
MNNPNIEPIGLLVDALHLHLLYPYMRYPDLIGFLFTKNMKGARYYAQSVPGSITKAMQEDGIESFRVQIVNDIF